MKSFLEEYGFAILSAIVVILLIAMLTPVGGAVKNYVLDLVNSFSDTTAQRLDTVDNTESKLFLSKQDGKIKARITTNSSTDQFKYDVSYMSGGVQQEEKDNVINSDASYVTEFLVHTLKAVDANSQIEVKITDLGTGKTTTEYLYTNDLIAINDQYYYVDGNDENGKHYHYDVLYNGICGGFVYKDGEKLTGLYNYNNGDGKYYENGILSVGIKEYQGVLYKDGNSFTGIHTDDKYYQNGVLGTGTYEGYYFENGEKQSFTVSFITNGGSDVEPITNLTNIPSSLPVTIKTGYVLENWYLDSGLTQPANADTPVGANTTLYAKWTEATYSVIYNGNGNTGGSQTEGSRKYTASLTLPTTTGFTKTGHNFAGWYDATSGGNKVTSIAANTASDKTVYAHWTPVTYTVSYNANGGSGAPGNQTKTYGTNLTLSSTIPAKSGYVFTGWATSTSGPVVYNGGYVYSTEENIVLYAIWNAIPAAKTLTSAGSYVIPVDGIYKLEAWGSAGGNAVRYGTGYGGKGGYAVGYKYLTAGTEIFAGIDGGGGGQGWNEDGGGGKKSVGAGGGGAAWISLVNGSSLSAIGKTQFDSKGLIIAGGGGGGSEWDTDSDNLHANGGVGGTTRTSGTFGKGGSCGGGFGGSGGGGAGYYSGSCGRGGGGGSSWTGGVPSITYKGVTYSPNATSGQNSGAGKITISFIVQ